MKTAFEFPIYIECPKCGSRYDENEIEITGIEADIFEQDIVTFECPRCCEVVKSKRYG